MSIRQSIHSFLAIFILLFSSQASAATAIGMVTGSKTGTYIAFGKDMARVAEKNGVAINVLDSKGSIDNIRRITSKEKVGLAIVQADVLGFLNRSKNPESVDIANKLRLVVPFYNEEVHILARKNIANLNDLSGKRVVVGSEGSGSMITAVNLFSILGITPGQMFKIEPPQGVVAVLNGEVDAVIFVGGKPVKMFTNMEGIANITTGPNAGKLDQVHFLPIEDKRLMSEYKPAVITKSDYSFVAQDVPTVAVTSLLVTFDYTRRNDPYYNEQCKNMTKLAEALRDNLIDLKANGHAKWKEVDLAADIGNWKRDECTAPVIASIKSSSGKTMSTPEKPDNSLENDLLNVIRGTEAAK